MSNRIPVFFTADLHIGHENAIRLDGRPFKDVADMSIGLIKRWNSTVPKDAIVYVLGDAGLGKGSMLKAVINRLNGTKILIRGNHDGGYTSMINKGFAAVLDTASLTIAGQKVTLSHCPLRGVTREDVSDMKGSKDGEHWHGESRNTHRALSVQDRGQFHLHGHIHSPNGGKSTKILGKQYDVGVVANGYAPVSLSTIESWITLTKQKEIA
jgi:calcineurin-like phosphoesterase family protein